MKVLIINTSEKTGGAAVAAKRLLSALNNNGVKAKMLVRDKETDDIKVVALKQDFRLRWHFLWERWCIFCRLHFSRKRLFEIDIANSGSDITRMREFKEADVIHLSWINQGMLSLNSIRKIIKSGKPVIWTMHDLWPLSSICHYSHDCKSFRSGCGNCPLLPGNGSPNDLSARVYRKKAAIYKNAKITFVTCSKWLKNQAQQSSLMSGNDIDTVPNPIDTRVFHKSDKANARDNIGLPLDKKVILFVSQRITDERKGVSYFIQALQKLVNDNPEIKENTCVAVLGGHSEDIVDSLPVQVFPLGYVSDEKKIVDVYNSADVFVLPSLSDNLPNTIMEAMACGVPCIGFNTGGIPEMIDHRKNGYVAAYKNAEDLANGMRWVLYETDYEALCSAALRKVAVSYSQASVSLRYIEIYNEALAYRHYKI
ncbi:MAG: glycosyltransferase family 4 protein [Prevotellaceae bacterium]|nr:glycosyltransferase family 4 protein [Prevotellaceae bacterium]